MGAIRAFEEIDAWKGAREITRQVYDLTKRKGFIRDFGLKDQICRAAVSIMSNIAEGYESQTPDLRTWPGWIMIHFRTPEPRN